MSDHPFSTVEESCQAPAAPAGANRVAAPLLTALFLAVALPSIPAAAVDTSLDCSWHAVLAYAHQHKWHAGTEIVFPFGPLGFLFLPNYAGASVNARLLLDFAYSYTVLAGAALLAWRMSWGWRVLLLALIAGTFTAMDTVSQAGLLCWGLLCVLGRLRQAFACAWVLALLIAFSALRKFNLLLVGAGTCVLLGSYHAMHGERRTVLVFWAFVPGLFLAGWLFLRQSVTALWPYIINSLSLTQGYGLAMGTPAPREVWLLGGTVAVLTFIVILQRWLSLPATAERWFTRLLLPLWLTFLAFAAWKHGYVRTDGHEAFFLGFAAILCAALEGLPSGPNRSRSLGRVGALVVCLLACTGLEWRSPGFVHQRTSRFFERFSTNLRIFIRAAEYRQRMTMALNQQRERNQLPRIRERVGTNTVDVFGQFQAYALFNDLNYHPRPVFQSYCAYTPRLSRLNGHFYGGPDAPDFVMFNLQPLDNRWPSLEDSAALRTVLASYRPLEGEHPFLLLKHSAPAGTNMTPVREGKAAIGEPILLSALGSNDLWMEIRLNPTLFSHVRQMLYPPPPVRLCAWNGQPAIRGDQFRAPTPMLAAGFIVSPLLRNNFDVIDLFAGNSNSRPAAVSVELDPEDRQFYRSPFWFRIYTFDHQLGSLPDPALARLKWPGFKSFPIEAYSPMVPLRLTTVEQTPAIFVHPWGHLKFAVPSDATNISGKYGFEESAYTVGTTDGAEFRIELGTDQGTNRLLYSELLQPKSNPNDRGLHSFSVELPPEPHATVLLKVLPGPHNDTTWDLACWAQIEIK
jgi:hypothetical protein